MKRSKSGPAVTRRGFLKGAAALSLGVPYVITSGALGGASRAAASERIVMGGIGMGGRGRGDFKGFMGHGEVQAVAVCDVKKGSRDRAKGEVDKKYATGDCATYGDFRELLDRGDIDAVMVATPDHWHAITTIEACKRGIDVFCEKPLSLTIREARAMVNAVRRYGRVFQTGSQQRA